MCAILIQYILYTSQLKIKNLTILHIGYTVLIHM